MENVIISYFKDESEAYQAFADLKKAGAFVDQFTLSQAALFKKSKDHIIMEDGFDTGKRTLDYTFEGGLMGALVGVLGGPLGMLLGFGGGSVVGIAEDADEAMEELNLISAMTSRMKEGDVAIVAVVQELSEKSYDIVFEKLDVETIRYRESDILEEIEHARAVEKKLQEQAKKEMRQERSAQRKGKAEEYRKKIKEEFAEIKKRFSSRG